MYDYTVTTSPLSLTLVRSLRATSPRVAEDVIPRTLHGDAGEAARASVHPTRSTPAAATVVGLIIVRAPALKRRLGRVLHPLRRVHGRAAERSRVIVLRHGRRSHGRRGKLGSALLDVRVRRHRGRHGSGDVVRPRGLRWGGTRVALAVGHEADVQRGLLRRSTFTMCAHAS